MRTGLLLIFLSFVCLVAGSVLTPLKHVDDRQYFLVTRIVDDNSQGYELQVWSKKPNRILDMNIVKIESSKEGFVKEFDPPLLADKGDLFVIKQTYDESNYVKF